MVERPMRSVVTGGCGFIGSHLAELLLEEGHEVAVIDNLSTGNIGNLNRVCEHPKLAVHEIDINETDRLRPILDSADTVFHLAALADIVPSIENPTAYHRANVDGTVSVLEAARSGGVKRLCYAASSSCYGIPDVYPTPESAPLKPQYPYALTKMLGEQCVLHWGQVYGLPVVSLRLFNVFGPRVRTAGTYGAVFGVFLKQKLSGEPLTIVGDGSQTRDFTFVTDVAEAFAAAARSDLEGVIMNVGSGSTYSINELVSLLDAPTVNIPKRPGEPDCTFADTSCIGAQLGWKPQVSFEDGVARMIENLDDWSDAPLWTPSTIQEATKDWFRFLGHS